MDLMKIEINVASQTGVHTVPRSCTRSSHKTEAWTSIAYGELGLGRCYVVWTYEDEVTHLSILNAPGSYVAKPLIKNQIRRYGGLFQRHSF